MIALTTLAVGVVPAASRAEPPPTPPPGPPPPTAAPVVYATPPAPIAPPPSAFETGMNGFGMGIFAGLAGGYLVARENGLHTDDWRPLVAGAGIGALAGGALGLTFGLIDNNASSQGRAFLVMRGMNRGGEFGLVAGAIIGGLAALKTDHPENILYGAAIGTLAGTALGLVVGSVERNPWTAPTGRPLAFNLGVAPCQTARGDLSWGPSLNGTF
jgi:hypothetical protein